MVKFEVKANPSGQYYFPKEVRAELGDKLTLICSIRTALIFPDNTPLDVVLASVEIIVKDLQQRLKLQKSELTDHLQGQSEEEAQHER